MLASQIEKYVRRGTVLTAVDAGSQKIKEWAERGYEPNSGLYHMVAGLNEVKSLPSIPEGAVLRSLRLNEEQEFVETVNAGSGWERVGQVTSKGGRLKARRLMRNGFRLGKSTARWFLLSLQNQTRTTTDFSVAGEATWDRSDSSGTSRQKSCIVSNSQSDEFPF
jgi:hypothetical protein